MDKFKKIAVICKLHYEKILLSVVLLALAVAVYFLWDAKQEEEKRNSDVVMDFGKRKTEGIKPLDLSAFDTVVKSDRKSVV